MEVHFVAALEQLEPSDAVRLAALAEDSGFAGTVLSDRFQPWLPQQGQSAFAWTVAGAVGQRISGTVTVSAVPGYRQHPASVAQASATLSALRSGGEQRDWHRLLLSAGDAIDEHVVGGYWPEAHERATRLFESAEIIRKLFTASAKGSDVRHAGAHHRLETSRLWTMPTTPPSVQIWAGGPVTARRAGREGFGIVVQAAPADRLVALLRAFREGAREGGHAPGRATVHAQLSWAPTDEEALANALTDWPMAGLRFPRGDIRSPFDVAQLARAVSPDDIRSRIPVSADPTVHAAHLRALAALGFDTVHVHNVSRAQDAWLEIYAREIAPEMGA
ncbi:LLM class flavin-dependent oxidoreductase [Microbacterium sp. H1-D42]|uniref:LLM class flavin-dependent oxidoreductase n=1 Tax=Microbacterium sp. H1-D42 TaxID=2925844 RepID=UPI001F53018E|nr:LLM class flavin-dependent oxidoreductase [Microbacterium sp. H1-D42]UNK71343.1 LLM class flavin-dependent oxidoreductase [Microbacterium sp. H1-D42]